MSWFRSNRRFGAAVALVALLLELAISFGHVHGLEAGASFDAAHALASASSSGDDTPNLPAADDDYCAICAVISLIGTGRIAHAPPLPPRPTFVLVLTADAGERFVAQPGALPFRARGPPIV